MSETYRFLPKQAFNVLVLSKHPLSETPAVNATLIVIDPGSSLFKMISAGRSGKPAPLALRPALVSGMTTAQAEAQRAESGNDALQSAWIETGVPSMPQVLLRLTGVSTTAQTETLPDYALYAQFDLEEALEAE